MRSKQLLWILVFLVCLSSAYAYSTSTMGDVDVRGWLNVTGVTNVTTLCLSSDTCISSWSYVNFTGGNTSSEIFAVVDNGTFLYIEDQRYNYTILLGGNSSNEIFAVVDNGTYAYYDMATSGNTSNEIFTVVDNDTWLYINDQRYNYTTLLGGNSSNEIYTVVDNDTFAYKTEGNSTTCQSMICNLTNDFFDWARLENRFLTAVNNVYLKMTGTTIYFDEDELNKTINIISKENANTSAEIFTVVDNNTFLYINDQRYNETNLITGNTSAELFEVIDNDTWLYLDDQRYNDSSLITGNSSNEIFAAIENNTFAYWDMATSGNTTEEIWVVVDNDSFMLIDASVGNTSNEIFIVTDNGTFLYIEDQRYNYTTLLGGNSSDEIFTVVDNGTFQYEANKTVSCYDIFGNTSDLCTVTSGSGGGGGNSSLEIWVVVDNETWLYQEDQRYNNSDLTGNSTTEIFAVVENGTFSYGNQDCGAGDFLRSDTNGVWTCATDSDTIGTGNSTTEIFAVIENGTFAYADAATSGNTSNEIFTVVDNSTFLYKSDNITIGDKITFLLGEIIDNLFDGWITIVGHLNVTGSVNATSYCINGNDCIYDWSTINASGAGGGNSSNEIFTVVDNNTFLYKTNNSLWFNISGAEFELEEDVVIAPYHPVALIENDLWLGGSSIWMIESLIYSDSYCDMDENCYSVDEFLGSGNSSTEIWAAIPKASPSNGDTTHLSTADQIFDWVATLNYVANAWDADGDIGADEISESKINFVTACAAGNHYYLSGNDLACEADDYNSDFDTAQEVFAVVDNNTFVYHDGDNMTGNLGIGNNNVTSVDCIHFITGGQICGA